MEKHVSVPSSGNVLSDKSPTTTGDGQICFRSQLWEFLFRHLLLSYIPVYEFPFPVPGMSFQTMVAKLQVPCTVSFPVPGMSFRALIVKVYTPYLFPFPALGMSFQTSAAGQNDRSDSFRFQLWECPFRRCSKNILRPYKFPFPSSENVLSDHQIPGKTTAQNVPFPILRMSFQTNSSSRRSTMKSFRSQLWECSFRLGSPSGQAAFVSVPNTENVLSDFGGFPWSWQFCFRSQLGNVLWTVRRLHRRLSKVSVLRSGNVLSDIQGSLSRSSPVSIPSSENVLSDAIVGDPMGDKSFRSQFWECPFRLSTLPFCTNHFSFRSQLWECPFRHNDYYFPIMQRFGSQF